jgi:hypothetical protein
MSSGNWQPNDPACLPVRLGSLADTHCSHRRGVSLRHIDWSGSRFQHAGNDSSEPYSSPDRRHNCDYGHFANSLVADVDAPDTAPDNDIAPSGFAVAVVLYASVRDFPPDLDADRIALHAAAAAQSVAADAVVIDDLLAAAVPAHVVAAACSGPAAAVPGRAVAAACSGPAAVAPGRAVAAVGVRGFPQNLRTENFR